MTRIFKAIAENDRAELTPEEYAQLAEMRGGRTCDGCAMCCKLPSIEEPEMTKAVGAWCDHCDTGRAQDWQLVKLGKYPFDEYCPMPSNTKDEYLASGDLVRLSIWNDYFPKRKTIPVKRK